MQQQDNSKLMQSSGFYGMPTAYVNPLDSSFYAYAMNINGEVLTDFIMIQRGYVQDPNSQEWKLRQGLEAEKFNEQGLVDIHKILSSVVNASNSTGNLEQRQINQVMIDTLKTLAYTMVRCKKKWNLKDEDRDILFTSVENLCAITMSKTKDGKFADHLFDSGMKENIAHTDSFDKNNNIVMQGGIRG